MIFMAWWFSIRWFTLPKNGWKKKLQTYFCRDTGCLNHIMWMNIYMFSFSDSFSFVEKGNLPLISNRSILENTRYQIMMKCWKSDPDARPTFTELKNQLKDMETLHKVRIVNNMKVSPHARVTGSGSAFYFILMASIVNEVLIASCYVTKTSAPQINGEGWAN